MSGIEPLAAFGLVCNVMQVIQFTAQTVSLCKKAFSTGSPDPELGLLIDDSAKFYQDLVNSIQSTTPLTEDETKLLRIAMKTQQAALEVRAEAQQIISGPTKGNILASIAGGIKARLRQNSLEKVQKKLIAYQHLLESGSLSLICKKTDALSLQQEARFNDLDDTLRDFIRSYSQGETRLEGLLARQSDSIKEAVRTENLRSQHTVTTSVLTELSRTHQDVSGMLQRMAATPPKWRLRETLLKSLKYDSMNDRFEQIGQPHEGTYQWIMRGIRPWVEGGDLAIANDENQNLPTTVSDCPHETAGLDLPWKCFPCWADSESSRDNIYWIQGKPGSGKSTLMKFLVSENGLWSDLKTFRSNPPLILSHFFWAAGHPVQKSLRGMLLAMLSQFLSANEEVLDDVIDNFPLAKSKHIHGDWSLGEVQALAEKCFAESKKPLFVFLDGLDEADADEMAHRPLLSFITKRLATIRTVKVCVASRPEPTFKNHLAQAPTLHLHHLTQFDMMRYIKAALLQAEPGLEGTLEFKQIVESVLDMAGGVFLWVALTVKSLSRGLMNGDTAHEIHLRLRQMPKGLHSLYQDMWSRLNEDESIYREEAAMYINLVLDWFTEQLPGPVCLFQCLMASRPSMMEAILNGSASFSTHELEGFLQEAAKRIETRTAGLLEVGWGKRETDVNSVGFIHRSALEFFQNTEEGRQILQYDTTPSRRRWTRMYSYLVTCMWALVTGQYTRGQRPENFWAILARLNEAWDEGRITEGDAIKILSTCKRIYETGNLSRMIAWHAPPIPDFAGVAAFLGRPRLLSAMVYRGQLGFLEKPISTPYRIYLLIAALCRPNPDAGPGESGSKVVEMLADDLLHADRRDDDDEVQGSGTSESPEGELQRLHLIILLSILQNQTNWPTSILSLPEAIRHFTLKCIPCMETKVLVIFTRNRIGDRGNDDVYELRISLFGDRILQTGSVSEMKMWVALEMNIVAVVELLLQAMIAESHDLANSETSRRVIDELKRKEFRLYESYTQIRVFHVPGELTHHVGLADAKELRLREINPKKDHDFIKSCLDRVLRDISPWREKRPTGQYQIPKLTKWLKTLERRSAETTDLGAFMKVVADNPLNKMAEEFMANPPDRYEP